MSAELDLQDVAATSPLAERERQRLLAIEAAARNLVAVKGRHHSAIAYQRLVEACDGKADHA